MAKNKSWPGTPTRVIYQGYKKAAKAGPAPRERDNQTVTAEATRKETAKSRVLHPATNKLTAKEMRRPK